MRQEYVEKTKEFLRLPTRPRGGGGGRRRREQEGDEFVNDSSDMGDWGNDEGSESRRKKVRHRFLISSNLSSFMVYHENLDFDPVMAQQPSKHLHFLV
uniref:Uncharacterized protein n=1 Tax=Parascaris equorum TaxID=6256 RepID=A0A914R9J7_PAREQ